MIATVQTINRSTYTMDKGEKIPMHQHTYMHNTRVLVGVSRVEIKGVRIFSMSAESVACELPADIPHEITAMIDGTVVINEFETGKAGPPPDLPTGGVMLVDGTIVR
jgi:quercetin dioxygenase-like cupin family protein